jgi:DNA-binding transcriptional ArsR family regulator
MRRPGDGLLGLDVRRIIRHVSNSTARVEHRARGGYDGDMSNVAGEPARADLSLGTILAALADPVRLTYVQILGLAPSAVRCGEVLRGSDITIGKSTLSHHLRVLREAGLTHTWVDGARRYVSLRREDVDSRFPGLLQVVCEEDETSAAETVGYGDDAIASSR